MPHSDLSTVYSIIKDPVTIVLEILGRICIEIERLSQIRPQSRHLAPGDRFRATILLYRKSDRRFIITPLRMVFDRPARPSRIRAAEMKGLLKKIWSSASINARSATAISLPKWDKRDPASQDEYFRAWEGWGVPRNLAEQFNRKGRFYMYVPMLKNTRRIGILVLDANIPITRHEVIRRVAGVVGSHIGYLEDCFLENPTIPDISSGAIIS